MLKCKDVVVNATDYVDKELSWSQSMSMALHLLLCGHCRRFIKYFKLSLQSLKIKKPSVQKMQTSLALRYSQKPKLTADIFSSHKKSTAHGNLNKLFFYSELNASVFSNPFAMLGS